MYPEWSDKGKLPCRTSAKLFHNKKTCKENTLRGPWNEKRKQRIE